MHSSAACASCAVSTADKSSYSAVGTLHPYNILVRMHKDSIVNSQYVATEWPQQVFGIPYRGSVIVNYNRVATMGVGSKGKRENCVPS